MEFSLETKPYFLTNDKSKVVDKYSECLDRLERSARESDVVSRSWSQESTDDSDDEIFVSITVIRNRKRPPMTELAVALERSEEKG